MFVPVEESAKEPLKYFLDSDDVGLSQMLLLLVCYFDVFKLIILSDQCSKAGASGALSRLDLLVVALQLRELAGQEFGLGTIQILLVHALQLAY